MTTTEHVTSQSVHSQIKRERGEGEKERERERERERWRLNHTAW
jgi:hypothetical protein